MSITLAAVAGIAFKLLMKAVVMPLLGADPINRAYHFLAHHPAALPGMLFSIVIGKHPGDKLKLEVWHNGSKRTVTATLGTKPNQ